MVCIYCGASMQVSNSRPQKRSNSIWRRRKCQDCGALFTTHETIEYSQSLSVRNTEGALQPLQRDKLFVSLLRSLQHRKTALMEAAALTDTALARISLQAVGGIIEASLIRDTAQTILERFDKAAAVHYRAYHP